MNVKKILGAIICIPIILSGVSGCKKEENSYEEKVILKYIMPGPGLQNDSEMVWEEFNRRLSEKLPNVRVDFEVIPLNEYKRKFMLMCSAREQIDIVNNYSLDFSNEVINGTFEPLDELLQLYGKETLQALPDWFMNYQKYNDVTYGIPTYQMCADLRSIFFLKEHTDKYLDIDELKNALYSSNVFTQGFYDILTKFISDMKEDGINFKDTTLINVRGYESLINMYGYEYSDPAHEVKNIYFNDDSYVRFKTAREWYEAGYIREDALSETNYDNIMGKYDGMPFWDSSATPFTAAALSVKYGREIIAVPFFEDEFIHYQNTAAGTSIMSKCNHKKEAMQVINLLQTDEELYNLLTFGIEGVHYTKSGDDSIVTSFDSTPTSHDNYGLYKWVVANTYNAYNNQTEPAEYKNWVFDECNSSDWRSDLIGFQPDTSKIQDYLTQTANVKEKYLSPLNYGVLPDWETYFNTAITELDLVGGKQIKEELQRQVDEFLASKAE